MPRLYYYMQKIIEFYLKQTKSLGHVLMFHEINDDESVWYDSNYSISSRSFEKLLIKLQSIGVEFCHISNIENDKKSNNLFITFDDGFEDVFFIAYPILKKRNIPFCIFITTDFINKPGYLTATMIKELAEDSLCTIGSHTMSHPILRHCSEKKNDLSSQNEFTQSKYYLENMLCKSVDLFAYPYGSIYTCSLKNIRQARNAGYKYAFSTLNSYLNKFSLNAGYFIPRININESNYEKFINRLT